MMTWGTAVETLSGLLGPASLESWARVHPGSEGPGTLGEAGAVQSAGGQGLSHHSPHLLAPGRWRVEAVVGQVASEDAQLTGDDPPGLPQLLAARGQEGLEVAGCEHCTGHRGGRPAAEAGQGEARDLG